MDSSALGKEKSAGGRQTMSTPPEPSPGLDEAAADRCGILFRQNSPVEPDDVSGCLLPVGHDGPHKFRDPNGEVWAWETDLECDCEHCRQADGDYCTIYWPLTVPT